MNVRKLEEIGMHHGRIITPENMNEIMEGAKSLEKNGYGLVGYMSGKMRKEIADNPENTGYMLTFFETEQRQIFFVVIVQAGSSQTRFLTHLSDPRMIKLLKWSGDRGFLQVILTERGKLGAYHFRPEFKIEDIAPILQFSRTSKPFSGPQLLFDMATAAIEIKENIARFTCGELPPVDDIYVNSVIYTGGIRNETTFNPKAKIVH